MNNVEIKPVMLKSINSFIIDDEKKLMWSFSNVFKKRWLYDSVINAFLFKIICCYNNYMSVNTLVTLSICLSLKISKSMLDNVISKEYCFFSLYL